MELKKKDLKNALYGCIFVISLLLISFLVFGTNKEDSTPTSQNVSIVDGKQVIDITVRGGYRPSNILASSDIETVLKFNTSNSYDCSTAISIPKLKIREYLEPTGSKEYEIGKMASGETLRGNCQMGMYDFQIKFQ